jgi:nuclear GTP-binding protein
MVRKKVLSKRLTLKDKYRIKKRVAEHEKNKRKEARKNPKKRSKLSKEPGVPNLWPQQQEMLKKLSNETKEIFLEKKEVFVSHSILSVYIVG